jgi:hypothetical protein
VLVKLNILLGISTKRIDKYPPTLEKLYILNENNVNENENIRLPYGCSIYYLKD